MRNSDTILASLDRFIRKYYKCRMIKGLIVAAALLLSLFLVVVLLEYFGYFGRVVRAFLFWLYLCVGFAILVYYVLVPLAKMFRLGKLISYEEAARIVGIHFPEVNDKLLNLIQLQKQNQSTDSSLLQAAIAQKSSQLSPVPFHKAVDMRVNRRYVKFVAFPLAIVVLMLLFSPTLLTEPSHRITHYSTQFERPAPFTFVIENDSLASPQHDDFELRVWVDGNTVPAEAYLNVQGNVYRMQQVDKTHFSYVFRSIQRDCQFNITAANVQSQQYTLRVFGKPVVVDFEMQVTPPAYTGLQQESYSNVGDAVVPEGSVVKWFFYTHNVDTLFFVKEDKVNALPPSDGGRTSYVVRAMEPFYYGFTVANGYVKHTDTMNYNVSVVADVSPMIVVMEMQDSSIDDRLFFHGRVKDDYGFSRLEFKTVLTNASDTSFKRATSVEIGLGGQVVQEFNYSAKIDTLNLAPGDKLEYYFEVWDNDAIHGPKSATSQHFQLIIPTTAELDNMIDRNSAEAQANVQKSLQELKQMQAEINELMRKLVDKKELTWQDKQQLQELSKKQEEVKKMLQDMQQQLNENKRLEQKYKDQSESLLQKQQELDRLMDEVMNEEMKQMMEEMNKMMEMLDKKGVMEQLDKLKMDAEDMEKRLDQNIELMRRLELEKKVEDAISKAEQLAEKQNKLADKTEQSKSQQEKEDLLKQQQDISQQYQDLKQELKQIKEDYKKLDNSLDFKLDEQTINKIDQEQKESENSLGKKNSKDASGHQKEAAKELDKLSEQLAEAEQDLEQEDLAEDAEMIRQLLKNLVTLSFNQEELIGQVSSTYIQDIKYQTIITDQNKIKSDFKNVEDSLRAIAKRQLAVATVVNRNLHEANGGLSRSLSALLDMNQTFYGNHKNMQASQPMQYTMTSFNNLALVLAESLDKMQDQMRQNQQKKNSGSCKNTGKKKQGNCSKPGNGKPSAKSMKQLQQELNRQMEALKKQLDRQGKQQGMSNRTRIGDKESRQISEEFARMAAQQEMLRRMMQEYGEEIKQNGASNAKLNREIDQMLKQMEQTETDLANRIISQQTINRQQQILTRMLEHEKAEMQREKEERRESHEGKEQMHQPSQSDIEKYERLKETNMDLFRTLPPTLSPYYKTKVTEYFYRY